MCAFKQSPRGREWTPKVVVGHLVFDNVSFEAKPNLLMQGETYVYEYTVHCTKCTCTIPEQESVML